MRSRYAAYVVEAADYLRESWHPDTRPSRIRFQADQKWLGLKIKACAGGLDDDSHGTVEFVARYKIAGKAHRLHEISEFRRIEDRWYYHSGQHLD